MKLRPIVRDEAQAALTLLAEGFPVLTPDTWKTSLDGMFSYADRTASGVVGWIAQAGGRDVGICLALAARRSLYRMTARDEVNLSAFYLRPGCEWMTSLFLRRMMSDSDVDYLDITASYSMREINRRLGFVDHGEGMVVVPTAIAAFRPAAGTSVVPLPAAAGLPLDPDLQTLLTEHDRLGCISLVVELPDGLYPVILARTSRKGLPGARVILARDRALIVSALGPLCRHLLACGFTYLEFDGFSTHGIAEALFWRRSSPVQRTRPMAGEEAIDLTYCELVFIPPPPAGHQWQQLPSRARDYVRNSPVVSRAAAYGDPATGVALKMMELGVI